MNLQWQEPLVWTLILSMPFLLLSGLVLPSRFAQKHRHSIATFITVCCVGNAAVAWAAAIASFCFKSAFARLSDNVFTLDALAIAGLLLTASLGAAVAIYSRRYMRADARNGRFMQLIGAAIGCVTLLPISATLPVFLGAWMAAGFVLHPLLTFNSFGRAAHAAAWQKFAVSRLGDVCLLSALYLLEQKISTVEFKGIQAAVASAPGSLALPAVLLVLGACFKSAQFPFFSWLPDTLDAPTPVSALMHAGIINAGGFLLLRCVGLIAASREAAAAAVVIGIVTMCVAGLALPCQTSVKRSLAYSTIMQMGFMMVEIGLGAAAAAAVHLVGHALYKAHAFLRSSTLVPDPRKGGPILLPISVAAHGAAGAVVVATALVFKSALHPGELVLSLVLASALGAYLASLWAQGVSLRSILSGFSAAAGLCIMYRIFEIVASKAFFHADFSDNSMVYGSVLLLCATLAIGALVPSIAKVKKRLHPSIYAAAQSGFYFSALFAERLLPVQRGVLSGNPAEGEMVAQKGGLWA
jgi:NAD(P)H-quinone oxidoreductase subunit 5